MEVEVDAAELVQRAKRRAPKLHFNIVPKWGGGGGETVDYFVQFCLILKVSMVLIKENI